MWKEHKVSVVFPAWNEEGYIVQAIDDFFSTGLVDEIVVVDNNSKDRTAALARKTKARVVTETRQGYGWALRRGLDEAKGDLIITAEPDSTFLGRDVVKLLAYSDDFDVVFGTRTTKELTWSSANMGWFMRLGNVFVAKLITFLFNAPSFSDVGCTMKLIKRDALKKIKSQFTVGKSHFSPEFMLLCILNGLRCVEIPVNYRGRVGESKISGKKHKAFLLGLVMIRLIISYRLKALFRPIRRNR